MTSTTTEAELSVDIEQKPGSQVAIRVEAPVSFVESGVAEAVRHLSRRVRVPGFRPGKVPAAMLERLIGWDAIRQEAVDHTLPTLYQRAIAQTELSPVGQPTIDTFEFEREKPVTFTATLTVKPEAEVSGYKELRITPPQTDVSEAQVDQAIENVRRRYSELEEVSRPAQAGDVLRARLHFHRGEESLGGDDEARDVELDRDSLLPGLIDGLIGLSAGEDSECSVTMPGDHPREELRGATVSVDVQVEKVQERKLPALEDALAKQDGHGETLEELRQYYRTGMQETAARKDEEQYEGQVLEALRDLAVVEIPDLMIESEIDRQVREMELRLKASGLLLDKFLEYSGKTLEQLRAEERETATQRVRLQLALEKVGKNESIEIDEAQVEREVVRVAGGRKMNPDQRRRLQEAARYDLTLQAAGQRMLEIARGEG